MFLGKKSTLIWVKGRRGSCKCNNNKTWHQQHWWCQHAHWLWWWWWCEGYQWTEIMQCSSHSTTFHNMQHIMTHSVNYTIDIVCCPERVLKNMKIIFTLNNLLSYSALPYQYSSPLPAHAEQKTIKYFMKWTSCIQNNFTTQSVQCGNTHCLNNFDNLPQK